MKIKPTVRFSTEVKARAFVAGCLTPSKFRVWAGDDGTWWVVTAREWSALANAEGQPHPTARDKTL